MATRKNPQQEKEHLAQYNANKFARPLYSVDGALFTFHQSLLTVLLVRRSNHPARGKWALPGGYVNLSSDADIEAAIVRKLLEKTGVAPGYLEQLGSYGSKVRDPRGWSVSTCYTALIAHQQCEKDTSVVTDVRWWSVDELHQVTLAFDHALMIADARERLKQKALYSIVPAYALPQRFSLPELQRIHEALIGKPLQKKSFRRRIEQAGLLIDTGEKRIEGGRPASLYRIKKAAASYNFVRNLQS